MSQNLYCYRLLNILIISFLLYGCSNCNPGNKNMGFIGEWDVPPGAHYTFHEVRTGEPGSVEFNARVYFQAEDGTGSSVNGTNHPLIIFGPGKFLDGPLRTASSKNYKESSYLLKHLALWGYICITIDFDVLTNISGEKQRCELFLHAIEYMCQQNRDSLSIFYKKIDTARIGFIGHSTGGEAAICAADKDLENDSPRNIKAVATISPTTNYISPDDVKTPLLMIYGTWDGDIKNADGYKLWDAAPRNSTKIYAEVYGANHFFFSDDIVASNERTRITRDDHQQVAKIFMLAFFDQYVRGNLRYSWPEYLTYQRKIDKPEYYVQYLHKNFLAIDSVGPAGTPAINTMGGHNIPSRSLSIDEIDMGVGQELYGSTRALQIRWNSPGCSLEFNFPSINVSGFGYISFRAAQLFDRYLNSPGTFKDFQLRLTDKAGASFVIPVSGSIYKGVPYPDLPMYNSGPGNYKSIPSTFRFPLSRFTGVNKDSIVKVTLLFSSPNIAGYINNKGTISFDDLEFTN